MQDHLMLWSSKEGLQLNWRSPIHASTWFKAFEKKIFSLTTYPDFNLYYHLNFAYHFPLKVNLVNLSHCAKFTLQVCTLVHWFIQWYIIGSPWWDANLLPYQNKNLRLTQVLSRSLENIVFSTGFRLCKSRRKWFTVLPSTLLPHHDKQFTWSRD